MKTYKDVLPGNDRGLSNSTVLSLFQESENRIWIVTDGGGINSFNPLTEKFTHYPSTWEDKVASICQFTPGKLLISIFSQGVFIFNPATGEKQPFTIVDAETTALLCNRGKAVNLLRNTHHSILFLGEHIYIYDLNTRTFSTAIEQEEQDIIGALLPIGNYRNTTYLNDTKHIYELDNHTNRLKAYTDAGKTRPSTPFQETKRETSGLGTITDWYTTIPPPKYRLRSRPLYLVKTL